MSQSPFDQRGQTVGQQINADPVGPVAQTPAAFYYSPLNRAQIEDLETRFAYHPPKEGQAERYTFLRRQAHDLAINILAHTPKSREQSLALTHLEEAVMWANAAIARNE